MKFSVSVIALLASIAESKFVLDNGTTQKEYNLEDFKTEKRVKNLLEKSRITGTPILTDLTASEAKLLTPAICANFDNDCIDFLSHKETPSSIRNNLSSECVSSIPSALFADVTDMSRFGNSFVESMSVEQFNHLTPASFLSMSESQFTRFFKKDDGDMCKIITKEHVEAVEGSIGAKSSFSKKVTPECIASFSDESLGAIGKRLSKITSLFSKLPLEKFLHIRKEFITLEMVKDSVKTFSCHDLTNDVLQHLPSKSLKALDGSCWENASFVSRPEDHKYVIDGEIAKNLNPEAFSRVNPEFFGGVTVKGPLKRVKSLLSNIGSKNKHASCLSIGKLFVQLDKNSIGDLPIECLSYIYPEHISSIKEASTFNAIPVKWISRLTKSHVAAISNELFENLNSKTFAAISPSGCSGLKAAQINSMKKQNTNLKHLGPAKASRIPVSEILSIEKDNFKKFPNDAFAYLTSADFQDPKQIVNFFELLSGSSFGDFKNGELSSVHFCRDLHVEISQLLTKIKTDALENFQKNCMPVLNPSSFENLETKDIKKLSTFFSTTTNAKVINMLPKFAFEGFSQELFNALSPLACAGLTSDQVEALSEKKIKLENMECALAMDPKEFAEAFEKKILPKDAVEYLNTHHMEHLGMSKIELEDISRLGKHTDNAMHPFTAVNADDITREIIQKMTPRQVALVNGFKKIDFETIRNENSSLLKFIHKDEISKIAKKNDVKIDVEGSKIVKVYPAATA